MLEISMWINYAVGMTTQRGFFADKLMDLANLAVAVLVFGQWVAGQIQFDILLLGLSFYGLTAMVSYYLTGENRS